MTSHALTAADVLARLYAAVDDRHLAWLDDLTIAAGLRRHCTHCHAMATADGCDQCGTTPAEQAIATTLAIYPDFAITRVTEPQYRYLLAHTTSGEGIYLIRDDHGDIADFTEDVYEQCVREGQAAGLNPVYHVHSRYNLFATTGVQWNQAPVPPTNEDAVTHNDSTTRSLITREQAESWAGRALSDDEMDRLDDAIPNSSIPEAIATIIDSFQTAD
ncbi:hypothetical protein [Nocardia sp. NPDC004260]